MRGWAASGSLPSMHLTTAVLLLIPSVALGASRLLPVQGALRSAAGLPVSDGHYGVVVALYTLPQGGTPVYTEAHVAVSVVDSTFSLELGGLTPLDGALFESEVALYVGVTVEAEPELPRTALRHVPYAVRADFAGWLECTGCVDTNDLAADVLAPFARLEQLSPVAFSGAYDAITGRPTLVAVGQECQPGQVVVGIDGNGAVTCGADKDTTYTGAQFATSGQSCSPGDVVTGVGSDGKVACAKDQNNSYDGTHFALSAQNCALGTVVSAIAANGLITCTSVGAAPVGSIVAFHKDLAGTPNLPAGWMACSGQTVSDPTSPYNGVTLPNLNGTQRFLRGATSSGVVGGAETHTHSFTQTTNDHAPDASHSTDGSITNPAEHLPPFMNVVWIIRVR